MRRILSRVRAAVSDYGMIKDGDKIAVGVSGGKDSLMLLKVLCELKRFNSEKFELVAITLDMRFNGKDGDFSGIKKMCDEYGVEYVVKPTDLYEIIFNIRKEASPCSLCSRMRRGILHDTAKELGCNKIALGHHLDDAAETFMMNLLIESRIGCFAPVTYLSRKDITMIRPLVYVREREIEQSLERVELPIIKSACPANEHTKREDAKLLLRELSKTYGDVPERIVGALQRGAIDRWEK
ncbi:MAG: tRNA 2-thiocytidine(32) synthetase TtcA [Clostridia bacterium]|nr:tRNA 2-thiocytidine(32) synthetase TtcA [Clostridia bacterium]MBO5433908.1 tRNA 2-thiocytidine(32) synthetase TtcA [Clostridia bacterium]MBP3560634.1 tRNA 2-thiocytidine(32) synthetase TtcA [Clostridia bacterium]